MNLLKFLGLKKNIESIAYHSRAYSTNKRGAFRIRYRANDAPVAEIDKKKYKVMDVSATGIKINSDNFHKSQTLRGKIYFHAGAFSFAGKVKRVNTKSDCTAIHLYNELEGKLLYNERSHLKNNRGYAI